MSENLNRSIQEQGDIDGLLGPRDEGRALGQGQDRALKGYGVVPCHYLPLLEAEGLDGARAIDRSPGRLGHRRLSAKHALNDGDSLLLSHRQGYDVHTLT